MSMPAETAGSVVLVVDDEPLNRDLLQRVLGREHEVIEAEDAAIALAVLEARPVAVLICDHLMPGRSGADLALEVQRRWPGTVVLLLTGFEDASEVDDAVKAGAIAEVIGKPWSAVALRRAVARAVGREGPS